MAVGSEGGGMAGGADGPLQVRVTVEPAADADAGEADVLGRRLRNELRQLDVDDVVPVRDRVPPPGAKGVDAAALTELLVTLSAGGGVFVTVIATLKDWLLRTSAARGVKVTIDGDTLELSSATAIERAELVEAFLRRHHGG